MSNFSKNLFKLNISGAAKSLFNTPPPIPIDPSTYTTPDGQSGWFFTMSGGNFEYYKYTSYASSVDAYIRCPPIPAIINRKAQCFTNGKTWVLEESDNSVSTKKQADQIRNLLDNPNPLQSWRDFEAQMYIFIQLFGFAIILPIKPAGFTNRLDTTSMWNIPASWINYNLTIERFNANGGIALTEIIVTYNGVTFPLQLKDLIIIRDFVPSFHQNTAVTFPGSKILPLAHPINNIIGAYESRNVLINYRGALGILSGDPVGGQYTPIPLTKAEKEELHKDFRRYGLRSKQFQVIMTSAQVKWQQMGYATKDLMLMEEVQESTKECCSGLNFPPFILGLADTTYNNMDAAEKGLYQNATIPDADNIYGQLTKWFGLKEFGICLYKDYTHISVLQENKESMSRSMLFLTQALDLQWKNDWITLNMVLEAIGEEPIPTGNVYYSQLLGSINANNPDLAKMLVTIQSRQSNGQFSSLTGHYNGISPAGINYNENGKVKH